MRVLLLSGDVHCGKTTLLTEWCHRAIAAGAAVEGVLAGPDVDGCRHMTSLPSFVSRRLQLRREEAAAQDTVKIGSYMLRGDVFAWARELVLAPLRESSRCPRCAGAPRACVCSSRYLVIDEIGPLELRRGEGLEPAVSEAISRMASGTLVPNLAVVAVVRSQCADEFLAHYGLCDATPFVQSADWRAYSQGIEPQFPFVKPKAAVV
jgi:nucleoside-triphosphatase THEP1